MSHTYKATEGTRFIANSDLSGDVEIRIGESVREVSITIPGNDLLEFMAIHLLKTKVAKLEALSIKELLKEFGLVEGD